jgi:alpha-1,2-glucosyltransferase
VLSSLNIVHRIHHPFLLSDNRHYTFYVWRRIYMLHPLVPYLLIPGYIACAWAWFLRLGMLFKCQRECPNHAHSFTGQDQTFLQTLTLPVLTLLTLLPTPLLEPRYFLIPYIFMRSQVEEVPMWSLMLEGIWYLTINMITMGMFLYFPREGVGRFMW